jgi:hypothetical protein
MIRKKGKIGRALIMMLVAFPATWELVRGLWRSDHGKWFLIPLAVFLCLTGILLVFAGSVEALAPFIYAIF